MGQRGRLNDVRRTVAAAAATGAIILAGGLAIGTIGAAARTEVSLDESLGSRVSEYAGSASPLSQMQLELRDSQFVRYVRVPDSIRQGIISEQDPLIVASLELDNGVYELGYDLPLKYDRAFASQGSLECQLVEATSGVPLLPQEKTAVRESDGEIVLGASTELGLPAMTIELRCSPAMPATPALSRTEVGDVTLYAVGLRRVGG